MYTHTHVVYAVHPYTQILHTNANTYGIYTDDTGMYTHSFT